MIVHSLIIRDYRDEDFGTIVSWWNKHKELAPLPGMMTPEVTQVMEMNSIPVMTLSMFTTPSKEVSFFEGFCSRPGISKSDRNYMSKYLFNHCCKLLREKGYKRVMIMTNKPKLAERYID